jgi:hypothetical protein
VLGAWQFAAETFAVHTHEVEQHAPGTQRVGPHVPPQMKVSGDAQVPTFRASRQPPEARQQAPRQGAGEQVAVEKNTFGETHDRAVMPVVQTHEGVQHAPAHGLGVQEVLQRKVKPEARHWMIVAFATHAPVALVQQAPVHVVLEQVTPGWKVPVQLVLVVFVQTHELLQQEPLTAHGFGEHEPLQMKLELAPVHVAEVAPVVQAPVSELQHTPGHGLGEQELDGPW